MKQLMLPTLLAAGLALGAQADEDFTIVPIAGTVEQQILDGDLILTVRSNSQLRVTGSGKIDILLIGGGGGGGTSSADGGGGGGGGGGFVYMRSLDVTAGTTNVIVGAGGAVNKNGGDSFAFGLTAYCGGKGGCHGIGGNGASGGGGGSPKYANQTIPSYAGGSAIYGDQGYAGGEGSNNVASTSWRVIAGGGGGGAGGPGKNAKNFYTGGAGGPGRSCAITGMEIIYGGGGGGFGSEYDCAGAGGSGGGGKGATSKYVNPNVTKVDGVAGTDWLGGGGGGGSLAASACGAAKRGGCGVVIIRCAYNPASNKRYQKGIASGGTEYYKKHYQFHKFTESSTFTLKQDAFVDMLIVGGGGGGASGGGGGGAGGVGVYSNVFLTAGTYDVTVGAGGRSAPNGTTSSTPENGGDSFVDNGVGKWFVSGGGAGGLQRSSGKAGASGGGGGSGHPYYAAADYPGGTGIVGLGHDGGHGVNLYKSASGGWASCRAGGGGGAGVAGTSGNTSTGQLGNGGDGVCLDFTGSEVWYAGGGGGGASKNGSAPNYYGALGGRGGGGRGGACKANGSENPFTYPGSAGEPNTGSGGGGGATFSDAKSLGGDGGSGIVVIRYRVKKPGLLVELRCK